MPETSSQLRDQRPYRAGRDVVRARDINTLRQAAKIACSPNIVGNGLSAIIDRDGIHYRSRPVPAVFQSMIGIVVAVGDVYADVVEATGSVPYPIPKTSLTAANLIRVYTGEESGVRPAEGDAAPDILYCLPMPDTIDNYRWWAVYHLKGFRFVSPPVSSIAPNQYPLNLWSPSSP